MSCPSTTNCAVEILIEVAEGAKTPAYASAGAAGADIRAFIQEPIQIAPGASALVPTGIKVAIPEGYEIQVRPRSGLAANNQITVLNSPGTIDSDYRGEIKIIVINHGKNPFIVTPEMRIAQLVVAPVHQAHFQLRTELPSTVRAEGGFGTTGLH